MVGARFFKSDGFTDFKGRDEYFDSEASMSVFNQTYEMPITGMNLFLKSSYKGIDYNVFQSNL